MVSSAGWSTSIGQSRYLPRVLAVNHGTLGRRRPRSRRELVFGSAAVTGRSRAAAVRRSARDPRAAPGRRRDRGQVPLSLWDSPEIGLRARHLSDVDAAPENPEIADGASDGVEVVLVRCSDACSPAHYNQSQSPFDEWCRRRLKNQPTTTVRSPCGIAVIVIPA